MPPCVAAAGAAPPAASWCPKAAITSSAVGPGSGGAGADRRDPRHAARLPDQTGHRHFRDAAAIARCGRRRGCLRGGMEGSERQVTVVLSTCAARPARRGPLPYDVLFILNQFFNEMSMAVAPTNGHYSQFTGDGLMALYGLTPDPTMGPRRRCAGRQRCCAAWRPQRSAST